MVERGSKGCDVIGLNFEMTKCFQKNNGGYNFFYPRIFREIIAKSYSDDR